MRDNLRVLITGASSGIGQAIAGGLLERGHRVVGIGRDFSKSSLLEHKNFTAIQYNLMKTDDLPNLIGDLVKDGDFDVLINNAGVAYYGTHENITPRMVSEIVRTNLEVPMILSSLCLKSMKTKGFGMIINVSSVTAERVNTHGCCYGASKAGLTSFSNSLFEEARKSNIKVVDIRPDMTDTELYRNADFTICPDEDAHLSPEDVAKAVMFAVDSADDFVVTELVIRPQKHRIDKK